MFHTFSLAIALAVLAFSVSFAIVFDDRVVAAKDPIVVAESSPTVDSSGTDDISTGES